MNKQPKRLTKREIDAICEALSARLAGEIDPTEQNGTQEQEVYASALRKMQERR